MHWKWFLVLSLAFLLPGRVVGDDAPAESPKTPAQGPPEGFVSLMPDTNMEGWQGVVGNPLVRASLSRRRLKRYQRFANGDMLVHWKVVDGVLEFDGKGNNISTIQTYGDFELYIDWKIPAGGESGIYLRGIPQIQIWDTALEDRGAEVGSGGLHNNKNHPSKPKEKADKPVGQWNTFYIKMVGQRVTVKLNDKLVVDNVVLENHWQPDQPAYREGEIELQAHGTQVWFRNIYLRDLGCPP